MEAKFYYVGIRVKDIDESVKFYSKLLGMKETERHTIEATKGTVAGLKSSDGKLDLELNHYDRGSPYYVKYAAGEGLDHLAFGVADLDAVLRRAKKLGYTAIHEVKTEKSRWAYVEDPNGIWIELFQG
ncbi:MAG TPA: VOC family protein [Nitrososphaerales archaeon]|nr:VOC family protein [Nitrososphaerales archaeon]